MNRASMLATILAIGALATTALVPLVSLAKDEPLAQNTMTVWVNGKGQSGFADKLNAMHAEMEAKGWKFGDLALYIEDGDMQGAFITYVR